MLFLVLDMIKMLEERFRILKRKDDTRRRLRIFERELSVSLQDVFFRELAAEGKLLSQSAIMVIFFIKSLKSNPV